MAIIHCFEGAAIHEKAIFTPARSLQDHRFAESARERGPATRRLDAATSPGVGFETFLTTGRHHVRKDKQYLANMFKRISASVTTVNAKIIAVQQKKISVEELLASVALEQLAMQHEALIVLATMVADPEITAEPLPELPKKIIGFH